MPLDSLRLDSLIAALEPWLQVLIDVRPDVFEKFRRELGETRWERTKKTGFAGTLLNSFYNSLIERAFCQRRQALCPQSCPTGRCDK